LISSSGKLSNISTTLWSTVILESLVKGSSKLVGVSSMTRVGVIAVGAAGIGVNVSVGFEVGKGVCVIGGVDEPSRKTRVAVSFGRLSPFLGEHALTTINRITNIKALFIR
jgi:hypothetical protein